MPKTDFSEEPKRQQFESTKFLFLTTLLEEILQLTEGEVSVVSERHSPHHPLDAERAPIVGGLLPPLFHLSGLFFCFVVF